MIEEIISRSNIPLKIDKFIPYGFDSQFFAVVNKDLYYRTEDHYSLLKVDYMNMEE